MINRRATLLLKRLFLALAIVPILGASLPASALSRINGKVVDAKTMMPLPGVNIVVKGTYLGAATDLDGNYFIPGVKPGSYDLQATSVGYKIAIKTDVTVKDNQKVRIDFQLEETVLALGQEVVFIGKKPLLDIDQTSSSRVMSSEDIENLTVEGVDDIIAKQVGVVSENNEIHIRGGRADENLYIIDNLSVKDPVSGKGLGIYLSADAIKQLEVITGGFNAEYGEAMSGLVNVETKEGGEHYNGSISLKTDNISGYPKEHQNTGTLEFSLGGPEIITNQLLKRVGINIPGKTTFFLNGYGYASDTFLPRSRSKLVPYKAVFDPFALREENNWSILAKVTYKPVETSKISYSYGRSLRINQGYFESLLEDKTYFPLKYRDILDQYNTVTREGIQQTLNWTHTLSKTTFYELTLGNFYNQVHSGVGRLDYREYQEPVDIEPAFYHYGGNGEVVVTYGDGYWDNGSGNIYHDHFNDTWQFKAKLTSQVHPKHQVKPGWNMNRPSSRC